MKTVVKSCVQAVSLLMVLPVAAVAGFGRFAGAFRFGAQLWSLAPGVPGDYLRIAFYKLTLQKCSLSSRISFGSFFAHPQAMLGERVYIGAFCILGRCSIGDRTQIASHVQILSGKRQHERLPSGQISGSDESMFETIGVGSDCWLGASSIIMASVGSQTTIGGGAVVVRPIGDRVVAVGNPAQVIKHAC
jgi:virginiamycin A acetyltransferase